MYDIIFDNGDTGTLDDLDAYALVYNDKQECIGISWARESDEDGWYSFIDKDKERKFKITKCNLVDITN